MLDSGKVACLLEWINTMDLGEMVSCLADLKDLQIISKILHLMTSRDYDAGFSALFSLLAEHCSESTLRIITKENFESGCEDSIAKVLSLLLSLSVSCDNNELFIHKMAQLSMEAQINVRQIIQEFFKYEKPNCLTEDFFDVLYQEGPSMVCDHSMNDLMGSDSMSSFINHTSMNSPNPMTLPSTPLPSISRHLLDEEIFHTGTSSCPSLRRQRQPTFYNDSITMSGDCSPMQDFFTSPAVNYKIRTRYLEQKLTTVERNLSYERQAKEEVEKILSDKEDVVKNLEWKVRSLTEMKRQKEHLVEEVENLHCVQTEKIDLQKENEKLRNRIEQLSTSDESFILRNELDQTIELNMKYTDEISSLREQHSAYVALESKLKAQEVQCHELQERCLQQESAIERFISQVAEFQTTQREQKEAYSSNIAELKQALDEKNLGSAGTSTGEPMTIVAEQRAIELEEELHQLQSTWMKPEDAKKLQRELNKTVANVQQLKDLEQVLLSEKSSLEAEMNCLNEENRDTVCTLNAEIQTLNVAKEMQHVEINGLQSKLSETSSQLQAANTTLSQNVNLKNTLQISLHEANSQLKTIKQNLVEQMNALERLKVSENELRSDKANIMKELGRVTLDDTEKQLQLCEAKTTNEDLVCRIEMLNKEKALQQQATEDVTKQLENTVQQQKQTQENLCEMQNQKSNLESSMLKLQQDITKLRQSNDNLQNTWTNPEAAIKLQEQVEGLKSEKVNLMEQITEGQKLMENLGNELVVMMETKDSQLFLINDLKSEVDGLKQKLTVTENLLSEVNDEKNTLQCTIQEHERNLTESNTRLCNLQSTWSRPDQTMELQNQLNHLRSEKHKLSQELTESKDSIRKHSCEVEKLKLFKVSQDQSLDNLETKLQNVTKEHETALSQINKEKQLLETSKLESITKLQTVQNELTLAMCEKDDEVSHLKQNLDEVKTSNKELTNEVDEMKKSKEMHENATGVLTTQNDLLKLREKEVESMNTQLQNEKDVLKVEVEMLQRQISKTSDDLQELRDTWTDPQQAVKLMNQLDHITNENIKLSQELSESKESNQKLRSEIIEVKQVQDSQSLLLKATQEKLEETTNRYHSAQNTINQQLDDKETLESKVVECGMEVDKLRKQLEAAKDENTLLNVQCKEAHERCQVMDSDMALLKESHQQAICELKNTEGENLTIVEEKQAENVRMNEQLLEVQTKLKETCEMLSVRDEKLQQTVDELIESEKHLLAKENLLTTSESNISNVTKELSDSVKRCATLQEQNSTLSTEKVHFEEQLKKTLSDFEEVAKKLKQATDVNSSLEISLEETKNQLLERSCKAEKLTESLQANINQLTTLKDCQQSALEEANKKHEELHSLVDEKDAENASLVKQLDEQILQLSEANQLIVDAQKQLQEAEERAKLTPRLKLEISELKAEISEWKLKCLQLETTIAAKTSDAETKLRNTELRLKEELTIAVRQAVAHEKIQQNEREAEKLTALRQELSDWQQRANSETTKNDKLMSKLVQYRQKVDDYNKLKTAHDTMLSTNHSLQKSVDHMRAERTQYFTQQNEHDRNTKQTHAKIRSLETQLDFANKTIKRIQDRSPDNRMPLMPGLQDTPRDRRLSLDELSSPHVNKIIKTPGKLVRCYSDDFLSSPLNRQMRLDANENDLANELDDSLNDILSSKPSTSNTHITADIHQSPRLTRSSRKVMHQRVCINVESSLLDSTVERRQYPAMRKQTSNSSVNSLELPAVTNGLDTSRGSADMNMNSSNLHNVSQLSTASNRDKSAGKHSLLAMQTSEEPEDMDWGSLNRLAELQRRNAKRLPHLKSSYPVETSGNTPSRSGDNVRVGDASNTVRRMSQMTESLQRSIANHQNNNRRMTINSFEPSSSRGVTKTRKMTTKHKSSDSSEDVSPMKTRRLTRSQRAIQHVQDENQWRSSAILEQESYQEDVSEDPRRESVMFEIVNTPKKQKAVAKKKETAKATPQTRSSKMPSSATKNAEKRSLMDRMRNPLKLNNRQRK